MHLQTLHCIMNHLNEQVIQKRNDSKSTIRYTEFSSNPRLLPIFAIYGDRILWFLSDFAGVTSDMLGSNAEKTLFVARGQQRHTPTCLYLQFTFWI